ncbi:MAG TPA: AsmA-like C-terminal domain-containing protein, partial [Alphaproteobacteria bacterium]
ELKNITGEFNAEMSIAVSNNLQADFIEFSIGTENTTITMPDAFPEPVTIKTGQIGARYDLNDKILSLQNTRIVLPHTTISLEATLGNPFQDNPPAGAMIALEGEASLKNLPLDELYRYWPIPLAPSARTWVTKHIKDGKANKANALFALDLPANIFDTKQTDQITLKDVHGEIKFKGLTTDYLPPMLPVKKIDGVARYTDHDFNIDTTSGLLRDTKVTEGTIKIAPLSAHEDSFINIDLKMEGPLQDPLVLLSQKPVEFTQEVGIDPKQVSGNAKTDLHLDFPLLDDLELEQLNVKAVSTLDNITVNHAYRNAYLRGSGLNLTVDNHGLALKGKATLSDAALDSLVWHEYFGDTAKLKREFILKGAATPQLLKDLNLDATRYFGNRANVSSTITEHQNGDTTMDLTADLTPARIMIPEMNTEKPSGEKGQLHFNLDAPAKKTIALKDLTLTSNIVNIDNATVTFTPDQSLDKIIIPQFKAGRSTISINATSLPRNKGWQATIKGNTLDASGFWSGDDKSNPDDKNTQPPIKLDLDIGTLYLDPTYPLKDVRGKFFIDNDVILQADLDAKAGDSLMVMRFSPGPTGDRVLKFESNNAGEAVKALGITDSMRGGTISIAGGSAAATPQQIRGNLVLANFSLVKAPILARLLNAFSLGGLLDLLNQKGLVFSRMENEFIHQDKQIILKKGKMAGASLGLNFAGTINQKNNTLDMSGTIVPIQGINKLASNIPLIGQILTGIKGEGLVAATYTIKGPTKDPSVMVNPLSVLTPGILRSIFFENNKE